MLNEACALYIFVWQGIVGANLAYNYTGNFHLVHSQQAQILKPQREGMSRSSPQTTLN